MDAEVKTVLDQLQETVANLAKSIGENKEKQENILKEVQEKQAKFEAKRKAAFVDDADDDKLQYAYKKSNGNLDLLIQNKSADERILDLQKANDDIMIVSQILGVAPTDTKVYHDYMNTNPFLTKAGMSGSGDSAWVPTGYSSRLFDMIRLDLMVAALHENVQMPTNVYQYPIVSSDSTGYLIAENTDEDAELSAATKVKSTKPGSSSFTLTAKKVGGRVVFSEELNEDSIVPILPTVTQNITRAISSAIENAIINGDTTSPHQDSDITDATEFNKAWNGYRKLCKSGAKASLATFNGNTFTALRALMGKYGIRPSELAIVTGIQAYFQMLNLKDDQNNQLVTTVDKYGPSATILNGELGKLYGIPIIVSEYVRENLNATGVYDGSTTTKTELIIVHKPSFKLGDRRILKVKTAEIIDTDQTKLVVTSRRAFSAVRTGSTDTICAVGYNIAV